MNPLFPFGGPEPRDDAYPLTDDAEVWECRRILDDDALGYALWLSEIGPEEYDNAAELGAARDLELWGCNPFEDE